MARPLTGRCALITGSVSGIGRAAAHRLALHGCNIVLNGFDAGDAIQALRDRLEREHGVKTLYSAADLRHPAQIVDMVQAATSAFGGVDILVNNAVVRHSAPLEAFPPEHWDEALAVNLSAAFHAIRLVLPHMKQQQWGRIVNVSSIYGLRAAANRVGYVTTKTALLGMTRAVAVETVADGITCNAVCPGTTDTPLHQSTIDTIMAAQELSRADAERIFFAGKQPTRRFVPAEDVAALVEFLCRPEADHITGAILPIDGGWSIA